MTRVKCEYEKRTMREFPIVIMKLIYDDEDSHGVSKGGLMLKDVHFRIIFIKNTLMSLKLTEFPLPLQFSWLTE